MSNKTKKHRTTLFVVIMMVVLATNAAHTQEAQDVTTFAELQLIGNCDPKNQRLWLFNRHDSKALIITVRWNLAGSKRIITDKIQIPAASPRELGCAAQADIVHVEFAGP
jgi:hypothetical protein